MNQIKFYKYAVCGLLLLNIAVLAFFLFTKPKPLHLAPSKNKFQSEVIEILNLSSPQISTFKKLAEAHNQSMKSIKGEQGTLLLPYFENLANPIEGINKDSVLNQFQQLERNKIEVTYQHFEEIKNILNKEQMPHFKGLMRKFIDQILLEKKKKPHPPKDFE